MQRGADDMPRASRRRGINHLAAAHEAPDRAHQLGGALVAGLLALGAHDAVAGVVVEEAEGDLVQRGLDGGDLREDVDAVAVLVDHLLDAAHLTLDAAQALGEVVLGGGVAGHTTILPPGGTDGVACAAWTSPSPEATGRSRCA